VAPSPCDQAQPASSAMPGPPPQLRNTRTRLRLSAARVYGIRGRAARQGAPRSAAARRSAPRNWVLGTGLRSCARSSSPGPVPRTHSAMWVASAQSPVWGACFSSEEDRTVVSASSNSGDGLHGFGFGCAGCVPYGASQGTIEPPFPCCAARR
jgi:hypothetical protein